MGCNLWVLLLKWWFLHLLRSISRPSSSSLDLLDNITFSFSFLPLIHISKHRLSPLWFWESIHRAYTRSCILEIKHILPIICNIIRLISNHLGTVGIIRRMMTWMSWTEHWGPDINSNGCHWNEERQTKIVHLKPNYLVLLHYDIEHVE